MDLVAAEDVCLVPGSRETVDTGIAVELCEDVFALVLPRSGLARRHGVVAVTGVVDSDYRGAIGVTLINHSSSTYWVRKGDRIANLVVLECLFAMLSDVGDNELSETVRGTRGFGSTDRTQGSSSPLALPSEPGDRATPASPTGAEGVASSVPGNSLAEFAEFLGEQDPDVQGDSDPGRQT
jgi:dUTP pyrophosphatase